MRSGHGIDPGAADFIAPPLAAAGRTALASILLIVFCGLV
jgi:hypothetical protein